MLAPAKETRRQPESDRERFERYESEKRAWIDANPYATPTEYQQAMRRIAEECGV